MLKFAISVVAASLIAVNCASSAELSKAEAKKLIGHSTYDVMHNSAVSSMLRSTVGVAYYNRLFLLTRVSVPATFVGNRFLVSKGCEPHNCSTMRYLLIDTVNSDAIAIVVKDDGFRTTASKKWEEKVGPFDRFAFLADAVMR